MKMSVPLPSRKERCQFSLRPVTNTLGDFISYMEQEDKGTDRVAIYTHGTLQHQCLSVFISTLYLFDLMSFMLHADNQIIDLPMSAH